MVHKKGGDRKGEGKLKWGLQDTGAEGGNHGMRGAAEDPKCRVLLTSNHKRGGVSCLADL